MKLRQLTQVDFQKLVAIHDQELRILGEELPGELYSASSPKRAQFLRIFNREAPFLAIPEFFFHLFTQMPSAHHDAPEAM